MLCSDKIFQMTDVQIKKFSLSSVPFVVSLLSLLSQVDARHAVAIYVHCSMHLTETNTILYKIYHKSSQVAFGSCGSVGSVSSSPVTLNISPSSVKPDTPCIDLLSAALLLNDESELKHVFVSTAAQIEFPGLAVSNNLLQRAWIMIKPLLLLLSKANASSYGLML